MGGGSELAEGSHPGPKGRARRRAVWVHPELPRLPCWDRDRGQLVAPCPQPGSTGGDFPAGSS